jgi:glycosyltransferase involved in cell wall biosynthesis
VLRRFINSVLKQSYSNIEYIVIDALSNDGTEEVVRSYGDKITKYVREKDKGIYDALNKGIANATGDVIGFLHADDLLASDSVAEKIAISFQDASVDAVYGNLWYVQETNIEKIVRRWTSKEFRASKFRFGWMPPHPTFYLRREHYSQLGGYRTDFSIAADYELMLRMLYKNKLQAKWIDAVLVKMRVGGKSNASLSNRLEANREDAKAWRVNGYRPPIGLRMMKPLRKVAQYLG